MIRLLLAASIAAFFTSTAVAQQCVPPQMVAAQAVQSVPDSRILAMLTGNDAQFILAKFNAIEPVTTFEVEGIAIIGAPNVPMVFLIGFLNGCTVFAETIPLALYEAWSGRGA